jgi:hypothetical protein
LEVGGHIDVDRARRKTWVAARLQIDSVGVSGKHNGQGSAVDTPDEQILNLMGSRWRECMLVLARAECHLLSLADQLELWRAEWQYARHPIPLIIVSFTGHLMKLEKRNTDLLKEY